MQLHQDKPKGRGQNTFETFFLFSLALFKYIILVSLIVWAGAKLSMSPGPEKPTQVLVFISSVCIGGLVSKR